MANQILAGAVFQASMVISGVDADNPPYIGPPPRIVAMRQYIHMADPGDNTVYTMAMDGTDLQTLPFPDGLVQNRNGDYAKNIATDGNMLVVADEDYDTVYVYDMATGEAPTSFSVPELPNDSHSIFLSSGRLFTRSNYLSPLVVYDIVSGTKVAEYDTSDNTGFHKLFVEGGKVVTVPFDENYPTQRYMYIYDIGDNDGSSEIKVALPVLSNGYKTNVSVSVGNEQIVFGNENEDSIFYIYDLNGENRIDVDTSSIVPGGYWGSSMTMADKNVGHAASAIGDGKIVINSAFPGMLFVCDLDGSNLNVIDLYNLTPSSEHHKFNGMASPNNGNLSIADGKIIAPAVNGRIDDTHNESEGVIWVLDLHARTVISQIPSPVLGEGVHFGYDHDTYLTTAAPLSVSGIESAYTLLSGGTNIYAKSTVGGVTWSFEDPNSGSNYVVVGAHQTEIDGINRLGSLYVYDANDMSSSPTELSAPDGAGFDYLGRSVAMSSDKIFAGAEGSDPNGTDDGGAVYVFDINDLSAQPTKLAAFDGANGDKFGWAIDASSNNIVVGAPFDDDNGSNSGSAYVFDINDLSAQPTKLAPSDTDSQDKFGHNVAINSSKVFVSAETGAYDAGGSAQGSVYVYDINDLSAQPVILSDAVTGDLFGGEQNRRNAIFATENMLVVGAMRYDNSSGTNVGAVYVYDTNDLSASPTRLTPFDGVDYTYFGYAVAATDDVIAVTADRYNAPRSVYVYDANDLSAQPTKISHTVTEDSFGNSLAIDENYLYVGESADNNMGAIYVYDLSDLSALPTKIDGVANGPYPSFGTDITISLPSPAQLNGTTVTQSDNVFTVTPGTEDASFDLTFTATDSSGNSASSTASFTFEAPEISFPHAGNFVDNFGGLQKNTSSLAHANGYNWASVHEWVNYGETHPSTNTDPRISYIRQDDDGYVYALFTVNNGQPLPGANGSYTGIHSYYGFGVWNASNAVFNLYSARSITEVDPVGSYFQVLAKTKVPYDLGLENFPAVWNEDVQGWVHTDWSA